MSSLSVTNPLIVPSSSASATNPLATATARASGVYSWYSTYPTGTRSSLYKPSTYTRTGTSARASSTYTLSDCPAGEKRYSTYGPCEHRTSPLSTGLSVALPLFFTAVIVYAFVSMYKRSGLGCTSRRHKGLITPIQYTGRTPAPTMAPASDAPTRVTFVRLPAPAVTRPRSQSLEEEEEGELARAIRMSLGDSPAASAAMARARAAARPTVRREGETEDPPPPYAPQPEIPPYEPR